MTTRYPGSSLENLKKQAKSLLKSVRDQDPAALERIATYVKNDADFKLNDAQLVISRELGFASWARLKAFVVESVGAFVAAANNGDIDVARTMLAAEPRLAQAPRALFRAAAMGKTDIVRLLVEHGADVNAATVEDSSYVGTPLLAATEMLNDADTVALLLELGADPNLAAGGETPLHMAMGTYARTPDKHGVIELLLDAGATHDQPEAVMAIHRGRIDLLAAQLDADPGLVHRRFEEVDYLWLPFNRPGPTLLHIAADYNEVEMGRLLLSRGADINARAGGGGGQSPIFHTVASWTAISPGGHCLPFLELLLAHGADLALRARVQFETMGASNCEGQVRDVTPLDFALAFADGPQWRNSRSAVALLREHGAYGSVDKP
ncbi:MAG: ankyrin repeat domain-containing protein [Gammaproteobacteria bacterium]|nr:ankyrin repeat domain-containing protein [Gammaproteobacteria bacterium]